MRSSNVSIDPGSNVLQFETALEMRHEDVVSRNKWEKTSRAMERVLALDSEEFLPGIRSLFTQCRYNNIIME